MKKAFTMLELVFVIVVIGILSAIVIPNTRTNPVQEAAIDLVSKIRYTQHLAMTNDKYAAGAWYKNRWQIVFSGNTYSIVSDSNGTYAKDPQNVNEEIKDIEIKGLNAFTLTGTECNNQSILSFDVAGRPLVGSLVGTTTPYTRLGTAGILIQTNDCAIKLTDGTETAFIDIRPETGYATIR